MKRRSKSFFGMHFDFHAKKNQYNIGEFCDYETIDVLLKKVKPDYIQCDTKGHEGISSYPTKIGTPALNMKGDVLKMWREETEKNDIALYSHYSGVWDFEAIVQHPDWAAVNIDGTISDKAVSVFSPYVDEILIPQLIEIAKEKKLNGVWVDGDCWGTIEDYSHWAKDEYKKETGLDAPKETDFEGREKYKAFCREGFLKYVKHYCDEIHKAVPDFQIASNWLYSSYAPEPEEIGVDFISGDYSPSDSINTAIFEGRAMQNSLKDWDLMCWGFTRKPRASKDLLQLYAEAGEVIALGGGFQIYNPQLVGSIEKQYIDKWAQLASFCRERQATCHKAKPVHEGALIFSKKALYNHKSNLFRWDSSTNTYGRDTHGLLYALLDIGYSTELLLSHQFINMSFDELAQFSFIAISDLDTIEEEIKVKLKEYVRNGGEVIVCGSNSTKVFEKELGINITEKHESQDVYFLYNEKSGVLTSNIVDIVPSNANILDYYYLDPLLKEKNKKTFSTFKKDGKGTWVGIYLGYDSYQDAKTSASRDILEHAISVHYNSKIVKIDNTHQVQVILTSKNKTFNVNLLNISGYHSNSKYITYEEILPIYNLSIKIKYPKKPKIVKEMPLDTIMDFDYIDGHVVINVPKLEIHSIITIE